MITAFLTFRPLADKAQLTSQINVALCYHYGWGVGKNDSEANRYCKLAAASRDPLALFVDAVFNMEGVGRPVDVKEGVKMLKAVIEQTQNTQTTLAMDASGESVCVCVL